MPIPSLFRRLSVSNAEEDTISIRRIISQSKWNRLRALLATEEGCAAVQRAFSSPNLDGGVADNRSPLHDMMCNEPPHYVVEKTFATIGIAALQRHLTNTDPTNSHCTPFHVALQNDVSYDTIKLMITICPSVVTLADERGSTPLMIECNKGIYADYDIVRLLIRSAPDHVMDEAADGSTALECALMSGAIEIFQRLQRFHAQEMRKDSHKQKMAALAAVRSACGKDASDLDQTPGAHRHSSACGQHNRHLSNCSQRVSRSSAAA